MNKKTAIVVMIFCVVSIYFMFVRRAEVVFVQQGKHSTDIVVKNLPLTQAGKIFWWENNKENLKNNYGIPKVDEYGNYYVAILNIGDGLKKITEANSIWFSFEHTDLYCFEEIKSEDKCIEKNVLMEVYNSANGKTVFMIDGDSIVK